METSKSFSGKEAEKDFGGRLFFLAAIFPFSNEKACLGVIAKTDFFYRLGPAQQCAGLFYYRKGDETDWQITKIFYGRHIRRLLM